MKASELIELPDDLIKQLTISDGRGRPDDTFTDQITELLQISGTSLNLNQLIIAAYRKYGVIWERKKLRTKVATLTKLGKINRVSNGVYTLPSR
jgi:hypothetical protein